MGDVLTSASEAFEAAILPFAPMHAGRALEELLGDQRLHALKFCRQASLGPYVADFFCVAHGVVLDAASPVESLHEARREAWLKRRGYTVLKVCDWAALVEREIVGAAIAAACGLSW